MLIIIFSRIMRRNNVHYLPRYRGYQYGEIYKYRVASDEDDRPFQRRREIDAAAASAISGSGYSMQLGNKLIRAYHILLRRR